MTYDEHTHISLVKYHIGTVRDVKFVHDALRAYLAGVSNFTEVRPGWASDSRDTPPLAKLRIYSSGPSLLPWAVEVKQPGSVYLGAHQAGELS